MTRAEVRELDNLTLVNVARMNCQIQRAHPYKSEQSMRARVRNRVIFAELAARKCSLPFDVDKE